MLFSCHCVIAACSFLCVFVFVIVIEHNTQSHSMHLYVCNTLRMMHWTKHKISNIFNCLTLAQWDQSVPARCYPQVRWDSYHSQWKSAGYNKRKRWGFGGIFNCFWLLIWMCCISMFYYAVSCLIPIWKHFTILTMMLLILKIHRSKSVI